MLKILVCKARSFVLLIILVLVNVVDNVVDLASQARVLFHGLFNRRRLVWCAHGKRLMLAAIVHAVKENL